MLQNHPVWDYQPGRDKAAHGYVESFLVVLDGFSHESLARKTQPYSIKENQNAILDLNN